MAPTALSSAAGRDPTVRNVALLALCQALAMSASSLTITVTVLVGFNLAADKSLATLPIAVQFGATMLASFPVSLLMKRIGRRAGFSFGAVCAIASGLLSTKAVIDADFLMLNLGAALFGINNACVFFYRFAAADTASPAFKSRAISLVLAGGLVAAYFGPQLAVWTRDLLAPLVFAGGYLSIAALAAVSLLVLQFIAIPRAVEAEVSGPSRPLGEIARQPVFLVAALSAMAGYGAMNLVMTSTPLAIVACNHPFESAAFVIQWHVVGMFAPSFFTGHLIRRFGCARVISAGALLILACVGFNLSGVEVWQFWSGLVLLGLGWNFMFIGGTTLLTDAYRPAEKAKVQGFNDLLVFGTVFVTALSSGQLFHAIGWEAVNLAVVAPVLLALLAAVWLGRRHAQAAAA